MHNVHLRHTHHTTAERGNNKRKVSAQPRSTRRHKQEHHLPLPRLEGIVDLEEGGVRGKGAEQEQTRSMPQKTLTRRVGNGPAMHVARTQGTKPPLARTNVENSFTVPFPLVEVISKVRWTKRNRMNELTARRMVSNPRFGVAKSFSTAL